VQIILKFFTQGLNEEGNSKTDPLSTVAKNYFYGDFTSDLIAFLPFGYLSDVFEKQLDFLWIVKCLRITNLKIYLSDRMLNPLIKGYIQNK
jgi:hypothetical protein